MTVIAIRRQKGSMYSVLTDSGYEIIIDTATLEQAEDIAVGMETDAERMDELQAQSDYNRARLRSLELVARKEYCRAELLRKLNTFPEEAASAAADEMERLGFVDDRRFAEMYADEAYRVKLHGRRRVAYDLCQRGVDRHVAEEAARELAPDPAEALDQLLEGRMGARLQSEADFRRCIATLTRYGYDMGDISAALRRFVDSNGED